MEGKMFTGSELIDIRYALKAEVKRLESFLAMTKNAEHEKVYKGEINKLQALIDKVKQYE